MKYYIGLDVGGTKTEGVLINEKGRVLAHKKILTKPTKKEFLLSIFSLIKKLKIKKVIGIGIGFPGQVIDGKVIGLLNLPQIKNLNLKKIIEKKFRIKTLIDNDANCFALAEARLRKKKNLIGLTLGSGVGGGLIVNREIYRGKDGLAGEFGQIAYKSRTFEDYCSGKFFVKNGFNKKSYERYGFHLGNLIGVVVNSLNPELIVLGGSISDSFGLFKKSMKKNFEKSVVYPKSKKIKIVVSKVRYAGAVGAAFLHNF